MQNDVRSGVVLGFGVPTGELGVSTVGTGPLGVWAGPLGV